MITLKLMRIELCLDFSFFAVMALFFLTDESGAGLCALSSCIVHELSHLAVMAGYGISPGRITLYGAGMRIFCGKLEYAPDRTRAAVYAAGAAANLVLAACFFICGITTGAYINLFTGIFNLLPIGELDGARLLRLLLIRRCRVERIDDVMRAAAVFSVLLCAGTAFIVRGGVSFTLLTTAAYFIILGAGRV